MATVTGKITKSPKRVQSRTGKVMAVATILALSDRRSAYPLRVIAFDLMALELMLYQFGQTITVNGRTAYRDGYQVIANHISH